MMRGFDTVAAAPESVAAFDAYAPAHHGANETALPVSVVGALVLAVSFGLLDVYQTYLAWLYVPGFYEMNVLSPFQDEINNGEFGGALALKIVALVGLTATAFWIHRAYPADHWLQAVNRRWVFAWAAIQVSIVLLGIYQLVQFAASVVPAA